MAKLIKQLPKDVQARIATTRIVLEDERHTSVIKKGETFYHRYTKRYHYIYDMEGTIFYSYEIDTATADHVLTRSKRTDETLTPEDELRAKFSATSDKLHDLTTKFIEASRKGSRTRIKLSAEMHKVAAELNALADTIAKS